MIPVETVIASIITAVISGGMTLIGVLITNGKSQAVMQEKIAELTREVREHNNFARRLPVVENKIEHLEQKIEKIESKIEGGAT